MASSPTLFDQIATSRSSSPNVQLQLQIPCGRPSADSVMPWQLVYQMLHIFEDQVRHLQLVDAPENWRLLLSMLQHFKAQVQQMQQMLRMQVAQQDQLLHDMKQVALQIQEAQRLEASHVETGVIRDRIAKIMEIQATAQKRAESIEREKRQASEDLYQQNLIKMHANIKADEAKAERERKTEREKKSKIQRDRWTSGLGAPVRDGLKKIKNTMIGKRRRQHSTQGTNC